MQKYAEIASTLYLDHSTIWHKLGDSQITGKKLSPKQGPLEMIAPGINYGVIVGKLFMSLLTYGAEYNVP